MGIDRVDNISHFRKELAKVFNALDAQEINIHCDVYGLPTVQIRRIITDEEQTQLLQLLRKVEWHDRTKVN